MQFSFYLPLLIRHTVETMVRILSFIRLFISLLAIFATFAAFLRLTRKVDMYNGLSEEQIKYIKEAAADMEERRKLVKSVCKKYRLGSYMVTGEKPQLFDHPSKPVDDHFIILQAHNLTYCPINKAASSTWRHQILQLVGFSGQGKLLDLNRALKSCITMITVRHPFERLVSAYRDKLENATFPPSNPKQHYLHLVRDKIEARTGYRGYGEVTFRDFIQHIIVEPPDNLDEHWRPYYAQCAPCVVDFDVIAHVETLHRDQVYLIWAAGLAGKIRPEWQNRAMSRGADAHRYFRQLSKDDIRRLHRKLRLDFELFGYDQLETYLELAE